MDTNELLSKIQQEIGYIPKPVVTENTPPQPTQQVNSIPKESATETAIRPRTAHLKPHDFPKGKSGNPGGRPPKKKDFDAEIWDELEKAGAIEGDGKTVSKQQLIIRKMAEKAMKGDVKAATFLAERILGKPKQKIESHNTNLNLNQTLEAIKQTKVVEATTQDGLPTEA